VSLRLVALLLAFAPLMGCGSSCDDGGGGAAPPPEPRLLVTAFEPFGGATVNASWEATKDLDGTTIAGHRVRVVRLPVLYDDMAKPLDDAIAAWKPDVVVSFGVGHPIVRVERTARNGYHPSHPKDNAQKPPPRDEIAPSGAATYATALPADDIVAALRAENIGAEPSDDAGGYLCNECFYRLMAWKGAGGAGPATRGFVHVPAIGAKNPMGGTYDLGTIRRAVRIVLETTLAHAKAPRS
jgi:pyroglutamyl-peptidase